MATMSFLVTKPKDATKSLKYWLHSHYAGRDKERPLKTVHASELTKPEGLCPRAYALYDVTKKKPGTQWLSTSTKLTFQMGRDQERNTIEAFAEMGKAVCHWRCLGCSRLHEFQSRPYKCAGCGINAFKPEEVRFESAVNGASCGVDMLLALGEPKLRPCELKTMAADQFKELKAPLAEHRLRTSLYLRLMAESDHSWASMVNHQKATILYISKSAYGVVDETLGGIGVKERFSPFKEFDVVRDDKATDYLVDRAKIVKDYREKKIGMPCGLCPTALSKRAAGCDYKTECFSGDYPPQHKWNGSA